MGEPRPVRAPYHPHVQKWYVAPIKLTSISLTCHEVGERKPHLITDDLTPYLENKLKIEQALLGDFDDEHHETITTQPPEGGPVQVEPLRADRPTGKDEPPLRLLSLGLWLIYPHFIISSDIIYADGGGVRGVSSLAILKTIMAKVAGLTNENDAGKLRPWEYFDMIAGTSTGGSVASQPHAVVSLTQIPA